MSDGQVGQPFSAEAINQRDNPPAMNGTRNMSSTQDGLKYPMPPVKRLDLHAQNPVGKMVEAVPRVPLPHRGKDARELPFRMARRIRFPGQLFIFGGPRVVQVPVLHLEARHVLGERASFAVREARERGHAVFRLQAAGQDALRVRGGEILVKPLLAPQRPDAVERRRRNRLEWLFTVQREWHWRQLLPRYRSPAARANWRSAVV